jgi:RNA polymerase-binding transcription factor DksA
MRELADSFVQDRRRDLLDMQDEIQRTLEMSTEEFNDLLTNVATKDHPAIAKEEQDKEALGRIQLNSERLKAMPDAPLCMPCQARREAETGPEAES